MDLIPTWLQYYQVVSVDGYNGKWRGCWDISRTPRDFDSITVALPALLPCNSLDALGFFLFFSFLFWGITTFEDSSYGLNVAFGFNIMSILFTFLLYLVFNNRNVLSKVLTPKIFQFLGWLFSSLSGNGLGTIFYWNLWSSSLQLFPLCLTDDMVDMVLD